MLISYKESAWDVKLLVSTFSGLFFFNPVVVPPIPSSFPPYNDPTSYYAPLVLVLTFGFKIGAPILLFFYVVDIAPIAFLFPVIP